MKIQIFEADTRVREDMGKAAIMRGPVVYCLEGADNGKDMHLLKMDENAEFEIEQKEISGESIIAIKAKGWRQQKVQNAGLYYPHTKTEYEQTILTWIPYYAWANRGEGEIQVWTRI